MARTMFSMTGGVRVELTRNRDAWILIPTPPLTNCRILGKLLGGRGGDTKETKI